MKLFKSCVSVLLITSAITANAQWSLTGNASTNPSANFLGTTDAQPLLFKTNGTETMRIHTNGNISLGTDVNPGGRLAIKGGSLPTSVSNNWALNLFTGGPGRLITNANESGSATAVITTFLDASNIELSAGSSAGYVSGITVNARSSGTTAPGAIRFWSSSNERMRITNTGEVGIGITSPIFPLSVNGAIAAYRNTAGFIHFDNISGNSTFIKTHYYSTANDYWLQTGIIGSGMTEPGLVLATSGSSRIKITSAGNVGIGTTSPSYPLTVHGVISNNSNIVMTSTGAAISGVSNGYTRVIGGTGADPSITFYGSTYTPNPAHQKMITLDGDLLRFRLINGTDIMRLNTSGVAINTECIPSGYKLAVKGNIICEKLKVKPEGGNCWADYVFAPEYKLLQLNEVEAFIKQNNHLPGVPSASDVDQNGIEVAEMDATLLKKIEELTLYMIEQHKQLAEQNIRLQKLEKENNELKEWIQKN